MLLERNEEAVSSSDAVPMESVVVSVSLVVSEAPITGCYASLQEHESPQNECAKHRTIGIRRTGCSDDVRH